MSTAPVDFFVVKFPGTDFSTDIATSLGSLITAGTIRVIDLLFLVKEASGDVHVDELTDLDDEAYQGWDPVVGDVFGYMSKDDALLVADQLEPGSSAVLVLVENSWALDMTQAISRAMGEVLVSERLPRSVVDDLVALHEA